MKLKDQAKKLPLSPGVYQYIGAKNEILYIGRATSLRRRVLQYFRPDIEPRIAEMVVLAKKIKYFKTDSVLEAIILEANLIKKHWPKYNVRDKDNRSFVWLVFTADEYSRPLIVRERELVKFPAGKVKVFGPFPNAKLLKDALRLLRRIFPYSTCKPNSGKPCFDYQVGLCPGTCVGQITAKEYQKNIKALVLIFSGKKKLLIKQLVKSDPDSVLALKHINDVSLISRSEISGGQTSNRIEAYDISHFSGQETVGAMAVFVDGVADKNEYRLFNIKSVGNNDLMALQEMIERRLKHSEWPLPELFLIDGGRPQVDFVKKLFERERVARPIIGISKFGGDKLVFTAKQSSAVKELAGQLKPTLLQARDEAHRFANSARRRKLRIK
jgi:excinuclease ABC subunit C